MSKRSSESEIKDFKTELRCLFLCVCVFTFLLLDKTGFFENFNLTFLALFCYKTKLNWLKQGLQLFTCRKLLPSKLCFHVCLFVCCCCCFFFLDQFSEKLHSMLFMPCAFYLVFRWGCIFPKPQLHWLHIS